MLKGTIGMMTREEVFERAKEYDFDAVKTYLEQGGNPLIFDGAGSSLIALLLWGYYKNVYTNNPDDIRLEKDCEDEMKRTGFIGFFDIDITKYCKVPPEERPHSIIDEIEYLIEKGISLNAFGLEEAKAHQGSEIIVETPLFHAVMNRDYGMTKYLLEHGADPRIQICPNSDYLNDRDFWLLEDLDQALYRGDRGAAAINDAEMAALLMHYGLDQWPGGFCIDKSGHVDFVEISF